MLTDGNDPQALAEAYIHYFDVVRADTPALLDEAYRLRYQVYCVENPFENTAEHTNGRELDPDDDRSIHALLVHRRSGSFAGTVRAILPNANGPHRPLPIERILAEQHSASTIPWPKHSTVEISRYAVSKEFRRRRGEELYADIEMSNDTPTMSERRMIPYITYGLIRGVVEICGEYGISHICAVMEPALIRVLGRFGLEFESIGGLVEHHGVRQPCVARLVDLMEGSRFRNPMLWQYAVQSAPGVGNLSPNIA